MIISVRDPSEVGETRRAATRFARLHGMGEDVVARIALVATEMATNLVKHAGAGIVVVDRFVEGEACEVELLSLDKGPGMADVSRCLADGFSTAGSLGTGLGAMTRNSDSFAIYSRPGRGTAIVARFLAANRKRPRGPEFGAVVDPYPGEAVCGDRWASGSGPTVLLVDGSGHGPLAAQAAETAVRVFADNIGRECVPLVEAIHAALMPMRGAAVAIARFDAAAGLVRFVGIGNIGGVLVSDSGERRMLSYNGIAGHLAPRIREMTYPFTGRPLMILHSDGISARWSLASYPGLAASHPSLIAGILFRDYRRGRDDASIVAMRAEA